MSEQAYPNGPFLTISNALMSQLDVVNILISSLGEAPVTTLSPSPSTDVDLALSCLNEADQTIQGKGWEWNREYSLQTTVAANGTVTLPANTLRVVKAYATQGVLGPGSDLSYMGQAIKIVARGLHLYDQINQTYVFATPGPLVDTIVRNEWDYIPNDWRLWIAYSALQKFQGRVQQSAIVLRLNPDDLAEARARCEQHQDDDSQENAIKGNINVVSALYGIGGMRRNRGGY